MFGLSRRDCPKEVSRLLKGRFTTAFLSFSFGPGPATVESTNRRFETWLALAQARSTAGMNGHATLLRDPHFTFS